MAFLLEFRQTSNVLNVSRILQNVEESLGWDRSAKLHDFSRFSNIPRLFRFRLSFSGIFGFRETFARGEFIKNFSRGSR